MKRLAAAATACLVLSALVPLHAASGTRAPSRLEDRIAHRSGGAISVLPRALDELDATDELRVRWEAFRERSGGAWAVYLDDRTALPTLVSGRGLAWLPAAGADAATLDDVDGIARAFLRDHVALLGDWSRVLELDRDASALISEGHWQIVYRQRVDGVRVENARLDVHVVQGRMTLMGAEHWGRPTTDGVPRVDAEAARAALAAHLGDAAAGLVPAAEPQLTLIAVAAEPDAETPKAWSGTRGEGLKHVLVWRLLFDEPEAHARWIGEVDAHDGTIGAFYDGTQYGAARGGVFPVSPSGNCAEGGCEVPGFPLPYADFTEASQPKRYGDDFGNLTCVDPTASSQTTLFGPYVRIVDTCGAISKSATCGAGVDLGVKHGENCNAGQGESPGNTSAARTSYYHVNRIAQVARYYNPANAWLQSPLTVNVNVGGSCNANWTGSVINMYGAGGNCNNMGENADILVHEWGHGYDQNDGGGIDKPSEAYSDIVSILATRDSCQGGGTYNDGSTCSGYGDTCLTCTGFRDFDWAARQSNTPATPTNFALARCQSDGSAYGGPCKREAHCESYVSSEAMYDLAARDLPASGMDPDSAWQLVDRLWFLTRAGSGGDAYTCVSTLSNSCGSTSWYQRMRVADDDDGNLANGTPHAAALFAAFKRHCIACGLATDATNQSTSGCPALAAPAVTRSTAPSGVSLSWSPVAGAAEYRVYRGEMGCHRQQVPLATLAPGQTSYLDDSGDSEILRSYRVQAFATNRACASPVSNCVSAPPGSRLVRTSYRLVDLGDGDGMPEPGESFTIPVSLLNLGADTATTVTAAMRLVGPGDVRVLRPSTAWPDIPAGASAESANPHFGIVIQPQAACGTTFTLGVSGAASNSAPFSSEIVLPMGTPQRDYTQTEVVPIPYLTSTPAHATFNIPDDKPIADLDISIDIFHQAPTQLVVSLTSPHGTTVRLHDRGPGTGAGIITRYDLATAPSGPGTMADFAGESLQGTWTLSVEDLDGTGVTSDGYIRTRTLHATIQGGFDCTPRACADPVPVDAPVLTMARVDDSPQIDLALTWSAVAASGYHVLQSTDPSFASGVELLANPTTQTSTTLEDGARTTPALTFFQVRAVNSCHHEGP